MDTAGLKLIVGLGNPGYEYHLTPHNLGFRVVDRLAKICGVELLRREAQSLVASAELDGMSLVLAEPQTFMNLSGLAVARLVGKYGVALEDLIVLLDDVALPLRVLRIRPRGSAGGHKGLKSVIGALGSGEFVRMRMGVKPEDPVEDLSAYLLGRFRKADLKRVDDMIERAVEAVRVILREGVQSAMNRFNGRAAFQEW